MARTTGSSGTGSFGDTFVIDHNGVARKRVIPPDARTPEQLRYRQLMRALNRVIPSFGPATDQDVIDATATASWWSSATFAQWAANHGTAIDADLARYGFEDNFQAITMLDDFNRADSPTLGTDWTALASPAQIKAQRCYSPAGAITASLYAAQTFDISTRARLSVIADPATGEWPFSARISLMAEATISNGYAVSAQFSHTPPYVQIILLRYDAGIPVLLSAGPWTDLAGLSQFSLGIERQADLLGIWYAPGETDDFALIAQANDDAHPLAPYIILTAQPIASIPCVIDDFGAAGHDDTVRQQWNAAADTLGIQDLPTPIAPFTYGERGEILFLVCCRLWRMDVDANLPDPVGSSPDDWLAYLATGDYPL
jgi:hypothetical protein